MGGQTGDQAIPTPAVARWWVLFPWDNSSRHLIWRWNGLDRETEWFWCRRGRSPSGWRLEGLNNYGV